MCCAQPSFPAETDPVRNSISSRRTTVRWVDGALSSVSAPGPVRPTSGRGGASHVVSDQESPVPRGSEPEPIPLEAHFYIALYTASRAMNSSYRPLLASLGLTHTQYLVMLALWERRVVTVGELGDRLQLSSGTLSPLLARLEQAGLISRRRRLDDVRTVEVRASPSGLRLRIAAENVPAVIARASGFTPTEIAELRDVLQVLTMRLSAADL